VGLIDTRHSVFFIAPFKVEVRTETLPEPKDGEVVVETLLSAISPGTEMLIYRGQFPSDSVVDTSIPVLAGDFQYPLKYGYSTVGRVIDLGSNVSHDWQDQLVFAFQPHQTYFIAPPDTLIRVPEAVSADDAVFLPNVETAVSFVLDAQPLIGEKVVVFGQGIVGLLTTALLSIFPLGTLVTVDPMPNRREASRTVGAEASLDPDSRGFFEILTSHLNSHVSSYSGADLTFELSGNPHALDQAIAITGFNGRVIIGSWYGQKHTELNLGGAFHRSRIKLISSQVSTMTPELSGRWTKARRMNVAWEILKQVRPSRFITHRLPVSDASKAYSLIDQHPEQVIQVVLAY
jgi:2-desacetyl-2-hydroxyethyl bacteriochlorophyllide A dehydrogenase